MDFKVALTCVVHTVEEERLKLSKETIKVSLKKSLAWFLLNIGVMRVS